MSAPQTSIADGMLAFRTEPRLIAESVLPDGSVKRLTGVASGPTYGVTHVTGERSETVFSSEFPDEAESAFNAFDGIPRGWNPAYQARGTSWPHKGLLEFAVYAAGTTVEDCVRGFLDRAGDTLRPGSLYEDPIDDAPGFQWSVSFSSDQTGTGFRAAGVAVPGGYVMTWWS